MDCLEHPWSVCTPYFGDHWTWIPTLKTWVQLPYLHLKEQGLGFPQKLLPRSPDFAMAVKMVVPHAVCPNSSLTPLERTWVVVSATMSLDCLQDNSLDFQYEVVMTCLYSVKLPLSNRMTQKELSVFTSVRASVTLKLLLPSHLSYILK